jgi:uncharacterized membrane protein YedE/YeeE
MTFESFATAHMTVLWLAFGIAFIFGAVANKTNFCTMGAVSDLVNMGDTGRIRAWILAMAVAMLGVTIIEGAGIISLAHTQPPYRTSNFAWLEYVVGGVLFGIGMTLGSGCGNKTLVRFGAGNLKSIFVFIVISIFAYFMVNPFPNTDDTLYSLLFNPWTSKATVSLSTNQDVGAVVSGAAGSATGTLRLVFGLVVAALLMFFVYKNGDFRRSFDNNLSGWTVGLAVLAAWYVSGALVSINADGDTLSWVQYAADDNWMMVAPMGAQHPSDVATQSYTFINPIGEMTGYLVNNVPGMRGNTLTFGMMAVFGVIAGSFVWALFTRGLRFEWFANVKDFLTHLVGGALMGIGGILALGCTIGQAITGVSTLAMGSILAFASIVFGSALTMKIQYYKLVYEDDATFVKALVTALVDMKLLPKGMRQLEAV